MTEEEQKPELFTFKIIFLANKGVGTHTLLCRLTQSPLASQYKPVAGMPQEEKRKRVVRTNNNTSNKQYEFWFHEHAGQEVFRGCLCTSYFRHVSAIIYTYDETDASSFAEVDNWIVTANQCSASSSICFLIGTKNDLIESGTPRAVSDEQIQEYADMFMTTPMHVSGLTGAGCEEAFNYISEYLLRHAKPSPVRKAFLADEEEKSTVKPPTKKKNCVCQ